ncbi:MAG: DUF4149 domain-containing protein [Arcobacteraceae bacterium]|jgi:hypothetical protein|nr:DUF4149 domain-containing protein [Arcobacteraceae bacterium]
MNKHKLTINKTIDFVYILLLLFVVGSVIVLGVVVAPVVFNSAIYLDNTELTRFDNGLLMSEIFRRFSNILNIVLLYITIYHTFKYKELLNSITTIISFVIFAVSSLLFSFYFNEGVYAFISKGETWINEHIEIFENFHKASEIDFTIILFSALSLAFIELKKKYH